MLASTAYQHQLTAKASNLLLEGASGKNIGNHPEHAHRPSKKLHQSSDAASFVRCKENNVIRYCSLSIACLRFSRIKPATSAC